MKGKYKIKTDFVGCDLKPSAASTTWFTENHSYYPTGRLFVKKAAFLPLMARGIAEQKNLHNIK